MSRSPTIVFAVARVYAQCATGAMIAHCWSAASPSAVRRTMLYISRFGPTETSYHDMNHRPGMLMRMLSWYSPPRYQAGSFGARLIIAPPVGTGIESAKIPRGPLIGLKMSCAGSVQNAFDQSTGGLRPARSQNCDSLIRSSCEVPGGNIGRCGFWLPYS